MPRTKKGTPPSYRRHSSDRAAVTVKLADGRRREVLLGPHGSPEPWDEYNRILKLVALNGGCYPAADGIAPAAPSASELSVNELILAFWSDAERRYGNGNQELVQYRYSLRPLKELYGPEPAVHFGPVYLKRVMQRMIETGWTRKVINRHLSRIKAVFSWGVSNELIPGEVAYRCREVKGLRPGEYGVKESPTREPAFFDDAEKVAPHCTPPVAAMLRLQYLAGMRSGEVRIMRTLDLDMSKPDCWLYRPGSDAGPFGRHKNAWRGQTRVIAFGPQAVAILKEWIRQDEPSSYLFSPRRWMAEFRAKQRAARKTPMTPSQRARNPKAKPRKTPGECYTQTSYARRVAKACAKAGVRFSPYALRHGRKMDVEREHGSEAARAVLGQKSIETTTHYGKLDVAHAAEVAKKMG